VCLIEAKDLASLPELKMAVCMREPVSRGVGVCTQVLTLTTLTNGGKVHTGRGRACLREGYRLIVEEAARSSLLPPSALTETHHRFTNHVLIPPSFPPFLPPSLPPHAPNHRPASLRYLWPGHARAGGDCDCGWHRAGTSFFSVPFSLPPSLLPSAIFNFPFGLRWCFFLFCLHYTALGFECALCA